MSKKDTTLLVTQEGLLDLEAELKNLKDVRRPEIAKKLEEAIAYGDLSENAEYDDAKNEQGLVEKRISEIDHMLKTVKIIDDTKTTSKLIRVGTTVTLQVNDEKHVYQIVGSIEADPFNGKISNESPVGKAILGKSDGDVVHVHTPSGTLEYKITKIEHK